MVCLVTASMNMKATILRQIGDRLTDVAGVATYVQDPDTGVIKRTWSTDSNSDLTGIQTLEIPCLARSIVPVGFRGAGDAEIFAAKYTDISWVKFLFPTGYTVTQRDRITNIKASNGAFPWKEDQIDGLPTIFEVEGVAPVIDPFGRTTHYSCLLKRSEVQNRV